MWDKRPFDYKEIDVMKPEEKRWRDLYEFDTPVIHVSLSKAREEQPEQSSKAKKLMHRFNFDQVNEKMDLAEAESS